MAGLARRVSAGMNGPTSPNAPPVVALSIEGNDLRLLYVRGGTIERLASRQLDSSILPGGVVGDRVAFGAAVRGILTEFEIPPVPVVAGFPESAARSTIIDVPKQDQQKTAEVVRRHARQDPVMGNPDYRLFYQVVAESAQEMRVFALAVRRAVLDEFVEGLRLARVTLRRVEWRPLALARAINQPHALIAHIEKTTLDVIVVSNNAPLIVRSVALGGADTAVADVARELEHTIAAYNAEHAQPLSPHLSLTLTGEVGDLPEARAAIAEQLQRQLAVLQCPFKSKGGVAIASFIVPIGLALRAGP